MYTVQVLLYLFHQLYLNLFFASCVGWNLIVYVLVCTRADGKVYELFGGIEWRPGEAGVRFQSPQTWSVHAPGCWRWTSLIWSLEDHHLMLGVYWTVPDTWTRNLIATKRAGWSAVSMWASLVWFIAPCMRMCASSTWICMFQSFVVFQDMQISQFILYSMEFVLWVTLNVPISHSIPVGSSWSGTGIDMAPGIAIDMSFCIEMSQMHSTGPCQSNPWFVYGVCIVLDTFWSFMWLLWILSPIHMPTIISYWYRLISVSFGSGITVFANLEICLPRNIPDGPAD